MRLRSGYALPAPQASEDFLTLIDARSHADCRAALRPYSDGHVTARGTFQKYFAQQELRDFIVEVLDEAPVAFAPGIFVVFRDKDLEQEILFRRQSRDILRPVGWQAPERPRREIAARPALVDRI